MKFEVALRKYLDTFLNQEMYFVNDIKNLALFKENPSNTSAETIRMKLSAVNDSDLRANDIVEEMMAHILKLNIDSRLQKGDLTVVEDIAQIQARGQTFNLLHFASVYCNLHRPEAFPVYSEQHFGFYRKYIQEYKLAMNPDKLGTYPVFCQALNDLVQRWGLQGKMNYLQLRKFGWLYAEPVVKETTST